MVEIRRSGDVGFNAQFSGDDFYSVLEVAKQSGLKWNGEEKAWNGKRATIREFVTNLKTGLAMMDRDIFFDPPSIEGEIMMDLHYVSPVAKRRSYSHSIFESHPPLAPFQKEDAIRMANQGRMLNGNDPGMGKTYETIKALEILWLNGEIDKIFLVSIDAVLQTWKHSFVQFTDTFVEDDIVVVDTAVKDQFVDMQNFPQKIVLCSFAAWMWIVRHVYTKQNPSWKVKKVANGGDTSFPKLRTPVVDFSHWGTRRAIVLDESHRIKDRTSHWARSLEIHKNFFDFRYLLTGTPAPNGVEEFYSQINFIDENILEKDYYSFLKDVAILGNRWSMYAIQKYKPAQVAKFLEHISPVYFRRFKKDHLELPEYIQKQVFVELEGLHKRIYQTCVDEVLAKIVEEDGRLTPKAVMNNAPYIIQALHNPLLLLGDSNPKVTSQGYAKLETLISTFSFVQHFKKFQVLQQLLKSFWEDEKKDKVIVWDVHPRTIEMLKQNLPEYAPIAIHGEVKPKDREILVNEFKNNPKKKLLIANPAVLGVGVNLQYIKKAVYFTRSYSLTEQIQADGRLVRPGMIGEAYSYTLIYEKSLEVSQDATIQSRLSLNDSLGTWTNKEDMEAKLKALFSP